MLHQIRGSVQVCGSVSGMITNLYTKYDEFGKSTRNIGILRSIPKAVAPIHRNPGKAWVRRRNQITADRCPRYIWVSRLSGKVTINKTVIPKAVNPSSNH